jgi:hypothetical protein
MKQILASLAALIRHPLIRGNDGVTDRTFRLSFQCCDDVLLEDAEAVGYGAVLRMC